MFKQISSQPTQSHCFFFTGWSFSAQIFAPLQQVLAQHTELNYYNYSWPVQCLSFEQAVEASCQQILELQQNSHQLADQQIVLIGWSLGGALAAAIYQELKQNKELASLKLINIASDAVFCQPDDGEITFQSAMTSHTFTQFQQNFEQQPQATLKKFLSLSCQGASRAELKQLLPQLKQCQLPAENTEQQSLLANQLSWLQDFDLRSLFASEDKNLLLLNASDDGLFTRANKAGITLDNSCHALPMQHAPQLAAEIGQWLNMKKDS